MRTPVEDVPLLHTLMDEEAHTWRERKSEVAAYKQLKREGVARDFLAAFSESSASLYAMKEGAAEVDAYLQRMREGGKDCHTASFECYASTLAHTVIHEERVCSESRRSAMIAARSAAVEPRKSARIAAWSAAVEPRKSARIAARSAAVEPRKSARIAAWSVAIDSSSPRCSSRRVPRVNVGSHPRRSARIAARLM